MYGRREENELEYENIYTGGGDWIGLGHAPAVQVKVTLLTVLP